MVTVLFFAQVREKIGVDKIDLDVTAHSNSNTVDQVVELLCANTPACDYLREPHLFVAINHEVSSRQSLVNDGDELAFFPAVTGG